MLQSYCVVSAARMFDLVQQLNVISARRTRTIMLWAHVSTSWFTSKAQSPSVARTAKSGSSANNSTAPSDVDAEASMSLAMSVTTETKVLSMRARTRNDSLGRICIRPNKRAQGCRKDALEALPSRALVARGWQRLQRHNGSRRLFRSLRRRAQRSGRKAARSSDANSSGCSHAAKWPPLSTSFQ